MNDVALGALVTGAVSLLMLVANLFYNFRKDQAERQDRSAERREERREWYRRTMFERRVGAVQEAYEWLSLLNRARHQQGSGDPGSETSEELRTLSKKARAWYDANTVWLQDGIPRTSEFVGATTGFLDHASGLADPGLEKQFNDAWQEIRARADAVMAPQRGETEK